MTLGLFMYMNVGGFGTQNQAEGKIGEAQERSSDRKVEG